MFNPEAWLGNIWKALDSIEQGEREYPRMLAAWKDLRKKIELRYQIYADKVNPPENRKYQVSAMQEIALDLRMAEGFDKLQRALAEENSHNQKHKLIDASRLLSEGVRMLSLVQLEHTPSWSFGPGFYLKEFANPFPKSWFGQNKPLDVNAYDVWRFGFMHRDKKPLNQEEYEFVVEYLIKHLRNEKESNFALSNLIDNLLVRLFLISREEIKNKLLETTPNQSLSVNHKESSFIKAFHNFTNDTFDALKNPSDPRHPAAKELIIFLQAIYKSSPNDWIELIVEGMINRDIEGERSGIVDFLNTLMEAAEETDDAWSREFSQEILNRALKKNTRPELFLSEVRKKLVIPTESLEEIERALIDEDKKINDLYGNSLDPQKAIDLPPEEVSIAIRKSFSIQLEAVDFNTVVINKNSVLVQLEFRTQDDQFRQISYIMELEKDSNLNFGLNILTIGADENSQEYLEVKKALLMLYKNILHELVLKLEKQAADRAAKQSPKSIEEKRPSAQPKVSKKRNKLQKSEPKEEDKVEVLPELQENFKLNSLRPVMILPPQVLQQMPEDLSPEFIIKKIELYNQGGLSLRKIIKQSVDGFDRFRLRFGRYRVIAEMREDGQLYVTEIVRREKDTYRT